MSSQDFVIYALQVAVMLVTAVVAGQIMRRLHQPPVLGEMIGGIFLGPTILGFLAPGLYAWLFASPANVGVLRDATIKLGMLFFLFIAGLEIDLADLRRLGKRAVLIGLVGTVVPILVGVGMVYAIPDGFWGPVIGDHKLSFALFIGMNLANSANPVIARILMDLDLMKGDLGTMIMTATIVDDLVNWTLFAIILADIAPSAGGAVIPTGGIATTILVVLLFFVLVLGIGRKVGPPALTWARRKLPWPSGFIALTAVVILAAGTLSEALGIHAFLGAFLAGVALGSKTEECNEAHEVIEFFVMSFFAPIYFVSMGMTANFITHFDLGLAALVLAAAMVSKLGAVLLGARLAGMCLNRETWAIAFGLNARGATGIILAGVGLANGLIDARIFVAIVLMALITSLISGPAMSVLLRRHHTARQLAGHSVVE